MKSVIMIVLVLVTPATALWVLPLALLFDSVWDGGLMVAANGYMLKIAPRANRSMFIAAITGLAGICGGVGAMAGGGFLEAAAGVEFTAAGRVFTNYHVLFAVNAVMRMGCIVLAIRVREPSAAAPEKLLYYLFGAWPMRFLLFPVGMYRRLDRRWGATRSVSARSGEA
jgi:hypothetical protein